MKARLIKFMAGGALLCSLVVGCGSSDGSSGGSFVGSGPFAGTAATGDTRPLIIVEPGADTLARGEDDVDTLEVEAFDAQGNVVFGPLDLAFDEQVVVNGIPSTARTIQIDYLRNGGFMLFRAEVPYQGQHEIVDPREQPTTPHNTAWKVTLQGDGFTTTQTHFGPDRSFDGVRSKDGDQTTFRVKGVCYSPTPINDSNKDAPQNGDMFWDSFKTKKGNNNIFGWSSFWAVFYDGGKHDGIFNIGTDGNSRGDIAKILELGCNTARLYAAHAVHLGTKGEFLEPTDDAYHVFSHKEFLDACYNKGIEGKSLRIIADIPMPDICFNLQAKRNKGAAADAQIAWWEDSFRKSVAELCTHPAVLGINIMNEQDGPFAHPNQGNGPDDEFSQYFWAQSKRYADIAKEVMKSTPGGQEKLVGWAFHDSPDLIVFGSKFPTSGEKYLETMTSFDYWGVNSYQTISLDSLTGLPAERFRGTYAALTGKMKKPLLLTELGWPATSHVPDEPNGKIYDDEKTHQKVADTVHLMFKQVFSGSQSQYYMGLCYFEFCDEWWKQSGFSNAEWNGGNSTQKGQSSMPNGWNDEEGFGIYGLARQGGRPNTDRNYITFGPDETAEFGDKGPKQPFDKLLPRPAIIKAIQEEFAKVK